MVHHLIDQIDFHRRAAGTAAGALQGLGELCMEAALRAVFINSTKSTPANVLLDRWINLL